MYSKRNFLLHQILYAYQYEKLKGTNINIAFLRSYVITALQRLPYRDKATEEPLQNFVHMVRVILRCVVGAYLQSVRIIFVVFIFGFFIDWHFQSPD